MSPLSRAVRLAGQALVAGHERRDARVIQHLQEIPLTKTRREDALRLIEYMPRMTAAGRRREAAKDIREMRRRYGAKETRLRLRVLARGGDYFSPRYVLRTRSERRSSAAASCRTMRPVWMT